MRFALIPDKFKGSLSAAEVCASIEDGIRAVYPGAEIRAFAASDGGDGFLEAIRAVRAPETIRIPVEDPLGRKVSAPFLLDRGRAEAYIEMAAASGMERLSPRERNPMRTHTRGTGQLIRHALALGARKIYIGLGGSATNDGGCGIASVFGYRFLDADGALLQPTGDSLNRIDRIEPPSQPALPESARIFAVNDVDNPLWGPAGAAFVYAAQKGATSGQIRHLDAGLRNLDRQVCGWLGEEAGNLPGSGAAGGTAFGLKCFLGARFVKGTDFILGLSGFESYLRDHEVACVFTGEGRIDAQTLRGKLIHGVVRRAVAAQSPVVAVCGQCDVPPEALRALGLEQVLQVSDPSAPLEYNMEHARVLVTRSVEGFLRAEKKK